MNLYVIIKNLLNELAQLYNDLNKEMNFRRKYNNLTQKIMKFSEFYLIFQRLSFCLKYKDKKLII